jgi:sigma-B regulation protein RsbU (phosphoserine phosphatase)
MSLRLRFLIAVNLTLLGVLAVFMVMDFRYQRSTHLSELTTDTQREAELLTQTIRHISSDERAVLQSVVNRATEVLGSAGPTGRDLAVLVADEDVIVPEVEGMSAEEVTALLSTADRAGANMAGDWVVGIAMMDDLRVYVFHDATEAWAVSAEHALWRLGEILLLGLLATALVNLMLLRLVIRPFSELDKTIRRIGRGELGATTGKFRSREFQSLAADLNAMSRSLAKAESDRAMNMAKASRLQARLQSDGVEVPGLRVVHWHEAADHVAGDFFDLLRCPDGSWLICIADVTGHGVAAAMGAAILKTLLWSAVESGGDLEDVIHSVNRRFSDVTLEEDFASLMLLQWHPETRSLRFASAGHETAYLICEGSASTLLESTGTLLGIAHDEAWEIKDLAVESGSRLILYTDGITEARSSSDKLFGRQRLMQAIETHADGSIQATIDALVECLRLHLDGLPADDDLTLVGLHFLGQGDEASPDLHHTHSNER